MAKAEAATAYELLAETRESVEDALARILQAKKDGTVRMELPELTTAASVLFLNLRQINRAILQEEDRVKSETEAAKSPLDHTALQLHNLLYEKNHYLKAIKACKDFKSKYPDIQLVPEEEFFRDAPEEMQCDPAIKTDLHKLMLQRLNFEMYQRKQLCKQRELLEARRKMLQENIANRKKFLSSLPSHLKALKKASLPVQQHLGILHTKRMKQHQLADLLPPPLYILYTQLLSCKEAFDELIDIEIIGSAKEAQALLKQQASQEARENCRFSIDKSEHERAVSSAGAGAPDEVKVDDEIPEDDDDSQQRRKRAKRTPEKETTGDVGVLQAHPLSVILQIYDDGEQEEDKSVKLLTLRFEYLYKLNVVCAGIAGQQEADQIGLLANLFPDDTGVDLPNQAGKLVADSVILEDSKRTLRWYKWAQHLAGIDFLSETPQHLAYQNSGELLKASVSAGLAIYRQQHRVQTILQQLRSRKKSQLALKEQLDSLQKLIRPTLKFKKVPWAAHVSKCHLRCWIQRDSDSKRIYADCGQSSSAVEAGMVLESETGREDGELPPVFSAAVIRASSSKGNPGSKVIATLLPSMDVQPGISNLGRPPTAEATQSRPHAAELSLLSSVDSPDDELMEYEPEDQSEDGSNIFNESKRKQSWTDYGAREYYAVLRRDEQGRGRVMELEVQVKVTVDYPARPPLFQLRLLTGETGCVRAAVPLGVVDVLEAPLQGEEQLEWFNELRTIEAKVNNQVLQSLPKWEEDYVLAHQIALLSFLFDIQVDGEIAPSVQQAFEGGVGRRSHRGRDRRIVSSEIDTTMVN